MVQVGKGSGGLQGTLDVPAEFRQLPVAVPTAAQEVVHILYRKGIPRLQPAPAHHLSQLPPRLHRNLSVRERGSPGGPTIPASHPHKARRELGEDGGEGGALRCHSVGSSQLHPGRHRLQSSAPHIPSEQECSLRSTRPASSSSNSSSGLTRSPPCASRAPRWPSGRSPSSPGPSACRPCTARRRTPRHRSSPVAPSPCTQRSG